VQTNPVTDPEVTVGGIISIRASLTGGGGTLGNISGGGPLNPGEYAAKGVSKTCLFDPNLGGLATIGGVGSIRISVLNNPYTLNVASAVDQTDNGGVTVRKITGFAHGPASLTSSTALPSGMVQFVSPSQLSTNITSGSSELISLLLTIRVHFIPEPGILLLIGSGVAGLALLGRSRMRR
jgi:hypothetical protein